VEARGQGRWGEHLEEVQRYERIGRRVPGNTGPACTDSSDAQTLGAAGREGHILAGGQAGHQNGMKGRCVETRIPLPGRENLCKRKPKGATGMKQGWKGRGWNKASRG